jgi:uncharacterized protein (TIGR00251 family)
VCAWGRRSSVKEQELKHGGHRAARRKSKRVCLVPLSSVSSGVKILMVPIQTSPNGVTFAIKVHPRAKKNAIAGEVGDALKVALTAPPVDGKANESCVEFFAKLLKVPRSSVTIAAGQTSRNKVIRVTGLSAEEVRKLLKI